MTVNLQKAWRESAPLLAGVGAAALQASVLPSPTLTTLWAVVGYVAADMFMRSASPPSGQSQLSP